MMAARDMLPVSEVLFLFFTGRGGSFLSQKEKEKNGAQKGGRPMVAPTFTAGSAIKFVGTGIARPSLPQRFASPVQGSEAAARC